MADTFDTSKRSWIMAQVCSQDTAPEMTVRRALHAAGHRFRLHSKGLPGKPDLALRKHKLVVFVHGCFWHRHKCKRGRRLPAANAEYWKAKLERNRMRDKRNCRKLRALGWQVMIVWECALEKGISKVLAQLEAAKR